MMQLNDSELEQLVKVIKNYKEIEQPLLFGSRATGNAKPNSDIDICLKGKDVTFQITNSIASQMDDLPLPYFFDVINFESITNQKLIQHISTYINHGIDLLQLSKDIILTK